MANKFAGMQPFEGYEDMTIERTNGVVLATLNVPEKLNALTPGIRVGLRRILEDVSDDGTISEEAWERNTTEMLE